MFYLEDDVKENCTGCKACQQSCPKKAIKMKKDKEGFYYPAIDEKLCIKCGLCKKVCPMSNNCKIEKFEQKVYYGINTDEEILLKSASGGAFTSIAKSFCDKNYVIFGATIDKKLKVKHCYIQDIAKIYMFRKSKYVQSDIGDSYIEAEKFLTNGKKVLFSGTPCQIAGLKKFLKKEYDNLLCVDLICHGVPSQKVFDKYISDTEKKYKDKIKNVNFRKKVLKYNEYNSRNLEICFENKKSKIENVYKNPYLKGYSKKLFYRPSCSKCIFANSKRISDITIADCWGIEKINPKLDVHKGVSLLIFNTNRGYKILNSINKEINMNSTSIDFAIKENEAIREKSKFNKNRKYFFDNINNMNFEKLVNKCLPEKVYTKIKRNISILVPKNVKVGIKKIVKW